MILSLLNDAYVKTHSWAFEGQAEKRCKPGRPLPLTQLRIVDGEMNDLPHDGKTSGELVVRAPWLTQGYFKDPKGSEKLWAGGWLHTGVADPKWIERPLGLLVAKPCQEVSEEQIRAHLQGFVEKGIIASYSVPDRIVFVEALPKTSVGKLDKKVMRERYAIKG